LKAALDNGYERLFGQQWPVWVGGLLFGFLNVFLFAYERPWSVADGVRNWGDWVLNAVKITDNIIIDPHLYSTSLLNFGIILGAMGSALLARQFQIRTAPPYELFKGLLGGALMGIGAALAFGCNIGGFFSATSAMSLAGLAMMAGLLLGAFIGLRILIWEVNHLTYPATRAQPAKPASEGWKLAQPWVGSAVLLLGLVLVFVYDGFGLTGRAVFLLFGLIIGLIMQRTRFCFVRAFREPFMTGDGETTKAVILAVVICTSGFTILKWADLRAWEAFVSPGFWLGSLIGGTIFGIGMSISGGCASGSLWRAGEGHLKLWVALISFALAGSYFRDWLEESGWIMKIGKPIFLPDLMDWKYALAMVFGIMALWYLIVVWNEVKGKLVIV